MLSAQLDDDNGIIIRLLIRLCFVCNFVKFKKNDKNII